MPILHTRVSWERPKARKSTGLTRQEQDNVRAAIAFLRRRYGGLALLAKAMGVRPNTLAQAIGKFGRAPSAAIALKLARVAGCGVGEMLSGAWPPRGACPLCGHVKGLRHA
ncbi:MAG: hypothetical protein ACRELY_22400 [Polyangiaceae bacterium]